MRLEYGNIMLNVPENVYYPREDSILMAKTLESVHMPGKRVLEIGCGSGFLSILMAKKSANVIAVDINPAAVNAAKENSRANGVSPEVLLSDLFENVKGAFDLIIFNPPYLPVEEGEHDLTYAGGKTGREVIERFIAGVKSHLKPDGAILVLISSLTGEPEVRELFEKYDMTTEIIAREKVPWEELMVVRARQKGL